MNPKVKAHLCMYVQLVYNYHVGTIQQSCIVYTYIMYVVSALWCMAAKMHIFLRFGFHKLGNILFLCSEVHAIAFQGKRVKRA